MNKELIDALREHYGFPPYVADEDVAQSCEGLVGTEWIRLRLAARALWKTILPALPRTVWDWCWVVLVAFSIWCWAVTLGVCE